MVADSSLPAVNVKALASVWSLGQRKLQTFIDVFKDRRADVSDALEHVATRLDSVESFENLVHEWSQRQRYVDMAEAELGPSLGRSLLADVVSAGFSQRYARLRSDAEAADRRAILNSAREAGSKWAVLQEHGELGSGTSVPYQYLEVHIESGEALVGWVEPRSGRADPRYRLWVTTVNLVTAEIADAKQHPNFQFETFSLEEFLRERDARRSWIEVMHQWTIFPPVFLG